MSSVFCFQTQLASIMEALSKAAVTEIGKLVEIESKMLKIEITRGRNEIASLTEKLQLMEKLLFIAQGGRREAALRGAGAAAAAAAGPALHRRERPPEPATALEPEATAVVAVKSETRWDRSCCHTDKSEQVVAHLVPVPQAQRQSPENHSQLTVVKEEPVVCSEEQQGEVQLSPDVMERLQASSDPRLFPECSVALGDEARWSPPLPPTNSSPEGGRSLAQGSASSPRSSKVHGLRGSAAKHFGCTQCGKSFRCFSQLEIHQRSHTGEKPFRCTLCGKRYAQKGHLYTHQRTHTGEKPYRCPVCGKGFIQKCTLDMHKRTHTGEKPFVCTKCGKGFTKKCNLKKHLHVHLEGGLHAFDGDAAFTPTLLTAAR